MKIHDFEATRAALLDGRTVIEGRSAHSVAVYQALILEPDDQPAAERAHRILATTARWRPLPDLTILITDDPATAVRRAETRDAITYTAEQWRLHHRAAALFAHLADTDPHHVRVLDRRDYAPEALLDTLRGWIADPPRRDLTGYPR